MEIETKQLIDRLYQSASERSLEYGCFLLRVTGMEHFNGDPLLILMQNLDEGTATVEQIDNCKDFWVLLINLSRLANGLQYMPTPLNAPLGSPYITDFYSASLPLLSDELRAVVTEQHQGDSFVEFADYVLQGYKVGFADFFSLNPRYVMDEQFTVTEFYIDDEAAGFKAHHSNGTMSSFRRSEFATSGNNLSLGDTVGYFVGDTAKLRKEWLINGEPMYKAKPWGKYNADGEWRPIVYAGDPDIAKAAALKFSDDPDVQGIFFYMYTTGFPVVEFVVKTNLLIPENTLEFDNGVNLVRVDGINDHKNEGLYDGWLRFEDLSEGGIKDAIDVITQTLDGLIYAFEIELRWQVKYRLQASRNRGMAAPTKKDLKAVRETINAMQASRDRDSLLTALSWYVLGLRADNPVIAFNCFYTSIESLARRLAEGSLRASIHYKIKPIKPNDHDQEDLLEAMAVAFESVYGNDHKYFKAMFDNNHGLTNLGKSILHKNHAEWDHEQYYKARQYIKTLREIAYDFISRLALQLPKSQAPQVLSHRRELHADASHTGPALIVKDLRHLPNDTWDIRPEWLSI